MTIRKTEPADLAAVLKIYAEAREFMRESGNPEQWGDVHPPDKMIEDDIAARLGYVCEDSGEIAAAFYFNIERDTTYEYIQGAWLNEAPYGVVHRIAVRRGTKGAGTLCLNWAFEQCGNLKIDTHEDNIPMKNLLGKLGFIYCGKIWVLDGTEERIAFQKAAPALGSDAKQTDADTAAEL
ncbi:MAG: GNAT family N-acetyltransferase [Oscillospiraceae bacterium]|jgi:RimJ/RimL family protein N-acetyltransferase|nr:GNAT family N-acetyltransferase [Oscillospiraceae bacterium]